VPVKEGMQRLYDWLGETRQPARAPIVDVTDLVSHNGSAAAQARGTNGNGNGALKAAARSKRIYALNGHAKETKLAKVV
jgi:hypothetical protein